MSKPVLFRVTNNLNIGGVQRRLRALLPLLTEHYHVHVVTYKERGVFFDELADLGVHTHFLPRKGHWNPWAIWKLARLFQKHKADIVHTHSFGANIFGLLAAALARVPVRVGQVHLCDLHWYGKTAWRRTKQIYEETLIHRLCSQRVLFVSEESRTFFQRHTRLPWSMLTLLHNGLELPAAVEPLSAAELGLPASVLRIGFVGRLVAGKGLEYFLRLAQAAHQEAPGRFHFLVVGDGPARSAQQAWVTAQGLEHAVSFLGQRQDIHACYASLDALVFCSAPGVEGMPGVVLEAAAHGLPILALPAAPLYEIQAYYPRLVFLQENKPVSAQLNAALDLPAVANNRIREHFSIEAMRDRTVALYTELLHQVTPCPA
ncbi:glycosyltransferase [Desulfovibrionales bacterium]